MLFYMCAYYYLLPFLKCPSVVIWLTYVAASFHPQASTCCSGYLGVIIRMGNLQEATIRMLIGGHLQVALPHISKWIDDKEEMVFSPLLVLPLWKLLIANSSVAYGACIDVHVWFALCAEKGCGSCPKEAEGAVEVFVAGEEHRYCNWSGGARPWNHPPEPLLLLATQGCVGAAEGQAG